MSEKKTLDFIFLDEGTKKPDTKPVVETTSIPVKEGEDLKLFAYFKQCFSDFPAFTKQYLTKKHPKFLLLAIWAVGFSTASDRVIGSASDYSSWGEAWALALFGGIISGALAYFIAGWFYNVRIKWSCGNGDLNTSRNIYIFSSLPIAFVSFFSYIFNHMAYGDTYFSKYAYEGSMVDIVAFLLLIAALVFSIRISYKAAREVMGVKKGLGIWWFVVAPAIFYILLMLFYALE